MRLLEDYIIFGVTEGEVVTVMSVANPELEVLFYALNKLEQLLI